MSEKINVVLPQKYDLVVGDTFQLFYRGIVDAPNPFCYDILAICEKGRNYPRYFEFLPEEAGEFKLTVYVYGANKVLLGKGETLLCVAEPKAPTKPLNVLCIGDSLTAGGIWPEEVLRRLTATDGEPKGLGFSDINFIGTCKKGDAGYEGYGGWRWESYFPTSVNAMWVVSKINDKTIEDQHSLWKDENGNIWQLETIADDYLKFNRYLEHDAPRPESGVLVHYKNAKNTSPITIDSSSTEKKSPFYDEETNKISFSTYCKRNGFSGIDAVYIFLGANGRIEAYMAGLTNEEHCKNLAENGKNFVRLIHEEYPNAKINIMGLFVPSVNGGMGASYGAQLPYCDYYDFVRFVMELNKAYEEWTLLPEFRDYTEFVNTSGQFDSDNNMPNTEKSVNTRNKKTEIIGTNGVHPLPEGYLQIADAVFRNLVHLCKEL